MPNELYNQAVVALQDPRVNAFLDAVIRPGEGTAGAGGYRQIYGGPTFSDMSHHPNRRVCAYLRSINKTVCSTAAGAFQFLYSTWAPIQRSLGLPDFDVQSQRLGAAELLRQNGSLAALRADDIQTAITRSRPTWTSLPGASQSFASRTMASAVAQYNAALGRNAAPAGGSTAVAAVNPFELPPATQTQPMQNDLGINSDDLTIILVGMIAVGVILWAT